MRPRPNAAYIQFFPKGSDEAVDLSTLDEEICGVVGDPVDPKLYCRGWFDTVAFSLALGRSWPEVREHWGEYTELAPIMDHLERNYDTNRWRGHNNPCDNPDAVRDNFTKARREKKASELQALTNLVVVAGVPKAQAKRVAAKLQRAGRVDSETLASLGLDFTTEDRILQLVKNPEYRQRVAAGLRANPDNLDAAHDVAALGNRRGL